MDYPHFSHRNRWFLWPNQNMQVTPPVAETPWSIIHMKTQHICSTRSKTLSKINDFTAKPHFPLGKLTFLEGRRLSEARVTCMFSSALFFLRADRFFWQGLRPVQPTPGAAAPAPPTAHHSRRSPAPPPPVHRRVRWWCGGHVGFRVAPRPPMDLLPLTSRIACGRAGVACTHLRPWLGLSRAAHMLGRS